LGYPCWARIILNSAIRCSSAYTRASTGSARLGKSLNQIPSRDHLPVLYPGQGADSATVERKQAADLAHQDQVGVADRPELRDWKKRRSPWTRQILFYVAMALIPIVVFSLLFYVARHS
jgi:hypothetical protein